MLDNPLVCDCHLAWILDYRHHYNLLSSDHQAPFPGNQVLSLSILLLLRDVAGAKARCANPSQNKNLLVLIFASIHSSYWKCHKNGTTVQVRKLTANEMTCELPNSRQSSNLGVRLQPSKSQVDLIACPTTSSSETFRLCLKGTPCDCAAPPCQESPTSFSSDGFTIQSWSLQTSPP